ncbi:MAG: 16S rRNA (adenine(1518)-N(6)/adenine(1519)-N(6))-dimethyltransferase RsmA [Planctomycetota bacterium]
MTDRDRFADYRARLEAIGFRPKRRFGQNFLLEPALHDEVAEAAGVKERDLVLEVGAGLGFLTRELASRSERVVAAEIDPLLVEFLRTELPSWPHHERIQIVPGDVLANGELSTDLVAALGQPDPEHFCVAANLPYAVSGPCLAAMMTSPLPVARRMGLLVQLEFAERICAKPGTAEFSGPTALVQSVFEPRLRRRVSGEVFRPRPNVVSAIVELRARPDAPLLTADVDTRRRFAEFVRAVHAQRRKRFGRGLERASARLGRDYGAPPELLDRRPAEISGPELFELFAAGETRS